MRVTVIPIAVGALGTVSKNLDRIQEEMVIKEGIETIQSISLLRSAQKAPGDQRRLAGTQTILNDYQC